MRAMKAREGRSELLKSAGTFKHKQDNTHELESASNENQAVRSLSL